MGISVTAGAAFVMSVTTKHRFRLLQALRIASAGAMVSFVTWGLLSPRPLRALRGTPLHWVRHVQDVAIHVCVFSALTLLLLPLVNESRHAARRLLTGSIVAHATTTELLQSLIPRRTCDPIDLLANLLGIMLGLTILRSLSAASGAFSPEPAG